MIAEKHILHCEAKSFLVPIIWGALLVQYLLLPLTGIEGSAAFLSLIQC